MPVDLSTITTTAAGLAGVALLLLPLRESLPVVAVAVIVVVAMSFAY